MPLHRRDLFAVVPAAILATTAGLDAAVSQVDVLPSSTQAFDSLPMHLSNGAQIRPVMKGKLATGESVEIHETTLPPGGAPHPPHHHPHSEMWLIREGTVELTISGTGHTLGPGGVGFVHSGEEHGIRNSGSVPAAYFVVAVGPGAGGA